MSHVRGATQLRGRLKENVACQDAGGRTGGRSAREERMKTGQMTERRLIEGKRGGKGSLRKNTVDQYLGDRGKRIEEACLKPMERVMKPHQCRECLALRRKGATVRETSSDKVESPRCSGKKASVVTVPGSTNRKPSSSPGYVKTLVPESGPCSRGTEYSASQNG